MNKGLSIFRSLGKLISDVTQYNSYGSELTAGSEVRRCIVYILDHIIFFLCR